MGKQECRGISPYEIVLRGSHANETYIIRFAFEIAFWNWRNIDAKNG